MIAYQLRASGSFIKQFDSKSDVSTEGEEGGEFSSCGKFSFKHSHQRPRKTLGCKLKSSLCKNFASSGQCPYGNRCQFAHGAHQLRINQDTNSSYKTKECNSYFKKGFCQYGYRCNFLHAIKKSPLSESARSINRSEWKEVFDYVRENNDSSRLMRILQ